MNNSGEYARYNTREIFSLLLDITYRTFDTFRILIVHSGRYVNTFDLCLCDPYVVIVLLSRIETVSPGRRQMWGLKPG